MTTNMASAWRWAAGAWAVLKVVTLIAAWASVAYLDPDASVEVPGYEPPVLEDLPRVIAGSWLRADALWYLSIAENGYTPGGSYAFFPLFPMVVRAIAPAFGGEALFAALLVSSAATVAGFAFLYSLIERLEGQAAARTAVVALAVFPASFFLVAPYAESFLLAFGTAALFMAARGRFAAAGAAGALAALSRPFGLLLAIPLAALGRGKWRRSWIAVAGPIAGLASWLAWAGFATGRMLGPLEAQSLWQRRAMLPTATFVEAVRAWTRWSSTEVGPYMLIDIAGGLLGIAIVVAGYLHSRKRGISLPTSLSFALYSVGVLLVVTANPYPPRPMLSMPRFLLALFPSFAGFALLPARLRPLLAAVSIALLGVLTALYVAARPIF